MTSSRRVVFDTNVTVSAALLPQSVPRQAFDSAMTRGRVPISTNTAFELEEVLRRPKFDKYASEVERLEFLAAIVNQAEIVEIHEMIRECRDPKDDKFLELAVSGGATHLVSGDDDLLCLHPFRGIAILTAKSFLESVE
jgi:uncharacterized protein